MVDVSFWPALIFWPAIVVGLVAAGLGLVRRRPSLLIGGAILVLPASLYLAATPRFQYVGFIPVACLFLGAYAVRRGKAWSGRLSVAVAVIFSSVVAYLVSFPILLHVVVAGAAIGIVAAGHVRWMVAVYVPIGILGAFVGALLSFGDAPFLIRYPYLNPWTLSILGAMIFVTLLGMVDAKVSGR